MNDTIRAFEHQFINVFDYPFDSEGNRLGISPLEYVDLIKFHKKNDTIFSLYHNRIKLKQYVGVLQIGKLVIEILPKADYGLEDQKYWKKALSFMIRTAFDMRGQSFCETELMVKDNELLDIFLFQFLFEIESIIHIGLTKKYIIEDRNLKSFKGKLNTTKDVQLNFSDRTKVFCKYQNYVQDHVLNQTLKAALVVVCKVTLNNEIRLKANKVLLSFESVGKLSNTINLSKLNIDRKHEHYKKGIEIAKMILANSSPDFSHGKKESIAFCFDMNKLFEEFIFKVLRKGLCEKGYIVTRTHAEFWANRIIKPDILIKNESKVIVVDTKWKYGNNGPADADLKQIFAYNERFNSHNGFLLYPGDNNQSHEPKLFNGKEHGCGVIKISIARPDGTFSIDHILNQVLLMIA